MIFTNRPRPGERYTVQHRGHLAARPFAVVSAPQHPGYAGQGRVVGTYATLMRAELTADCLNRQARKLEAEAKG